MELNIVCWKIKTIIKFEVWLVLMNLENHEESFNVSLHCIDYIFYITFYVFTSHFYILHKPTTPLKGIDKIKKISHLEKLMLNSAILAPSPFLTKGRELLQVLLL